MTIEHLAPQSSMSRQDKICGQLGNLLLIPENVNQALANSDFKQKKLILAEADVQLPQEVKEAEEWGDEQIIARTRKMAEEAYHIHWKI